MNLLLLPYFLWSLILIVSISSVFAIFWEIFLISLPFDYFHFSSVLLIFILTSEFLISMTVFFIWRSSIRYFLNLPFLFIIFYYFVRISIFSFLFNHLKLFYFIGPLKLLSCRMFRGFKAYFWIYWLFLLVAVFCVCESSSSLVLPSPIHEFYEVLLWNVFALCVSLSHWFHCSGNGLN